MNANEQEWEPDAGPFRYSRSFPFIRGYVSL